MTNPGQTPEIDPLDAYEKRPSVSFDITRGGYAKGVKVQLVVQDYPKLIDDRDPETKAINYWPLREGETTPRAKQKLVLNVIDLNAVGDDGSQGVEKTMWAKPVKKGKALFAALQAAQKKVREETGDKSYRVGPGDTLWVVYVDDDISVPAKMGNHPKMFAAKLVPGQRPAPQQADPFQEEAKADPWSDTQPKVTGSNVADQPTTGGDPFGGPIVEDEPPF